MNYGEYLLEELNRTRATLGFDNIKIIVSQERSFRMPRDNNVILFIYKELTGNYVLNIKTTPVQIIVWSELNTFDIAKQILDLFIANHKNGSPDSVFYDDNTLIKQDYDTSVILKAFTQSETGYRASFYCFGSYVECSGLQDIKNVRFRVASRPAPRYEDINYIDVTLSYSAVLNTSKKSGEEISTSKKQEAGLTLRMTLMNDSSELVKRVNQIMLGELKGNTSFTISFDLNEESYSLPFVLSDCSFSADRVNAPGLLVTFTR